MDEPAPIDSKDAPGEYRGRVRAGVFRELGCSGLPVAGRGQLVGSWDVAYVGLDPDPTPATVYQLAADGTATVELVGQEESPSAAEWRLNPDGTFSMLRWCPPIPELGIDEPQRDEDRRHIAALPDGRLVMWNGDGSSLKLLSPRASG